MKPSKISPLELPERTFDAAVYKHYFPTGLG